MNREEIINTAYKYAKDGKFSVQASYCDNSVPDVEIKAYEERAWLLIKNVSLEKLDVFPWFKKNPYKISFAKIPYFMRVGKRLCTKKNRKIQ
ncbi:MAG: hypothetical protein MJY98_08885 [Fibrobacter sp.]|nr:hypothetical protein [Fibrobacter sp.]